MQVNRLTLQSAVNEWKWLYIASDIHLGEQASDITLFKKELQRAQEIDARVLITGDLFGMISKKDPRYRAGGVVAELRGRDDLVNVTLDYAYEILKPYANMIDMISMGNHEIKFQSYHDTEIIGLLLDKLHDMWKEQPGKAPVHGGNVGFLQYQILLGGGSSKLYDIFYDHGSGGDAPVTKGMIGANRIRCNWGADLYILSHNHYRWADALVHGRMNTRGHLEVREQRFIRSGNFHKSYLVRDQNHPSDIDYPEEMSHSLKPLGGTFLRVRVTKKKHIEHIVEV